MNTTAYSRGKCKFLVQSDKLDVLEPILKDFDTALAQAKILKNSKTTTAGIVVLADGTPVFLKRTNNKGLRFTLRYLFRKARPYRAMKAAVSLDRLGIRTPAVYAVGEKRTMLYLHGGYMIQESDRNFIGVENLVVNDADPAKFLSTRVFPYAAQTMAKLHNAHIIHGDLKLGNFFRDTKSGNFGIWDLDSVRHYPAEPPVHQKERELARLIASCLMWLDGNPGVNADFFNPAALTGEFLTSYLPALTTKCKPDPKVIASLAEGRWKRSERKG